MFKDQWGIPQCDGSVNGTHISVTPPAMNHTDYFNCKRWYFIVAQAVIDHKGLLTDFCVG